MEATPTDIQQLWANTAAEGLCIRFIETGHTRVVAELDLRDDLRTVGGSVHGGVLMAFADTLGATGAALAWPAGAASTTVESKSNFFAGCSEGTIRGQSEPLHSGRRTATWQTRLYDATGRLLAVTTQTQLALEER